MNTENKFQSTFPHGERRLALRVQNVIYPVSIHVPARGTTVHYNAVHGDQPGFNPRSRTGNDSATSITQYLRASFNPRSRTGNDRIVAFLPYPDSSFNPRSRTGNDSNHPQISFVLFALIYAIIPINSVQRNLQHALLLTSPQNYSANPPGILCSLQTRTTLSLRCLLLKITKNIHCTTS